MLTVLQPVIHAVMLLCMGDVICDVWVHCFWHSSCHPGAQLSECENKNPTAARFDGDVRAGPSSAPTPAQRAPTPAPAAARTQPPPRLPAPALGAIGAPGASPAGGCVIKGNIGSHGDRIYHVPGGRFYAGTKVPACANCFKLSSASNSLEHIQGDAMGAMGVTMSSRGGRPLCAALLCIHQAFTLHCAPPSCQHLPGMLSSRPKCYVSVAGPFRPMLL